MRISNSNQRIRALLNELNISQTEFCDKTGIKKSALSNYLNGDRQPRQDQLDKIADAFGVDPAWLMGYDVRSLTDNDNEQKDFAKYQSAARLMAYAELLSKNEIRKLLDVAKGCSDKQIDLATEMLKSMKKIQYQEDNNSV